jgi:hypothetical protein
MYATHVKNQAGFFSFPLTIDQDVPELFIFYFFNDNILIFLLRSLVFVGR